MGNLVAIVGRPNVGKSTLFNRLTKTRQAIVNEQAGTTRDRQYGKSEWVGHEFSVVDTGGWVVNSDDVFEEEIRKQVSLAIDEADVILFVVDVVNGVPDLDMAVASILRRTKKPVIMVANKTDNNELQYNAAEFYKLGLGDPYCISALSGSGTGVLEKDVAYAGLVLCILHSGTGGNIPGIIYTLPGMREPVYGARRKAQRMVSAGVHV